jgi:hypothetical protein
MLNLGLLSAATALSDIPYPTTGKLQYIGSILLTAWFILENALVDWRSGFCLSL